MKGSRVGLPFIVPDRGSAQSAQAYRECGHGMRTSLIPPCPVKKTVRSIGLLSKKQNGNTPLATTAVWISSIARSSASFKRSSHISTNNTLNIMITSFIVFATLRCLCFTADPYLVAVLPRRLSRREYAPKVSNVWPPHRRR